MKTRELISKLELIVTESENKIQFKKEMARVGMAFKEVYKDDELTIDQAGIYFVVTEGDSKSLYRKKSLHQLDLNFK